MIKKLAKIIFAFAIFLTSKELVNAASLGVGASSTSVTVGSSVVITVKAKGLAGTFKIVSSDSSVLSGGESSTWIENGNVTYIFKARQSGRATVTVSTVDVSDFDTASAYSSSKSVTISVKEPVNYSSNNYLKSLNVEGYDIGFSKEKTSYSVNIKKGTDKINITGSADDDKSRVSGLGEKSVEEGDNSFEITVTAENGSTRTYKINAIVEEANPVNVKIGEKDFRVVKKADLIEAPEGYEKTSIKIDDTEVPAFKNNKTKLTLIGVKDDEGNISLVVYEDGKYNPYKELKIGNLKLYQLEFPKNLIRAGYKKKEITIGDEVITVYAKEGEEYYLIYAMNLETGEKNIYKYDDKEKTIQRDFKTKIETKKEYGDEVIKAGIIAVGSFISFIGITFKMAFKNKETM